MALNKIDDHEHGTGSQLARLLRTYTTVSSRSMVSWQVTEPS